MINKHKCIYIFLVLALFSFVLYGCAGGGQGGGSNGSAGMTSAGTGSGSVKLVINWPQIVKNFIKTIPATATKIVIDIYKADNENGTIVPATTINRSGEASSITTTILGIPIGNIKIKAAALNSQNATVATGNTTTALKQGNNSGVTLNLVERYSTYAWLSTDNERSYDPSRANPQQISQGIHTGVGVTSALTGTPTISPPGMSVVNMNAGGETPQEKIRGVYYVGYNTLTGSPELTVVGDFDINFQNSSYYSYDLNNASFLTGAYVFNINNTNFTINNPMSDYCSLPEITYPPRDGETEIDVTKSINIEWLSLGSDYVYLINACHYKTNKGDTSEADVFWTSNDYRDLTTSDMSTFTNLINNLTSKNSCTVPANLFTPGMKIKIMVIAINKKYYSVDETESVGRTFLGMGQDSVTYGSY